jgi:hypothetical protein
LKLAEYVLWDEYNRYTLRTKGSEDILEELRINDITDTISYNRNK